MDFREFIGKLSERGALTKIRRPVSALHETAALLKQLDGRPVYLERVKGYDMPVAGNLLSSMDLLAEGIGIERRKWIGAINGAIDRPGKLRVVERTHKYAKPDLDLLPILSHHERDAGPYITSSVVIAQRGTVRNASIHRLLKLGRDRVTARLVEKRDLHSLYLDAKEHGEDLPVSIAIGNSPSVLIAASTSAPSSKKFELEIAAALDGRPLDVAEGKTNNIVYPVGSEIILEGKILHDETAREGPFADLTGTYDVAREQPVIAIETMASRQGPIYQAILPAGNEHKLLMGQPRTPAIYKTVRASGIDVKDVFMTPEGAGWLDAVVAIRKRAEGDGKTAILASFDGHRSLKKVTIVDHDVDATNPLEVGRALTLYCDFSKDRMIVQERVKGSSLDPMATPEGIGNKVGFDATKPLVMTKGGGGKWKFMEAKIPHDLCSSNHSSHRGGMAHTRPSFLRLSSSMGRTPVSLTAI